MPETEADIHFEFYGNPLNEMLINHDCVAITYGTDRHEYAEEIKGSQRSSPMR